MAKELLSGMTVQEKEVYISKWAKHINALKPAYRNEIKKYVQSNPKLKERFSTLLTNKVWENLA